LKDSAPVAVLILIVLVVSGCATHRSTVTGTGGTGAAVSSTVSEEPSNPSDQADGDTRGGVEETTGAEEPAVLELPEASFPSVVPEGYPSDPLRYSGTGDAFGGPGSLPEPAIPPGEIPILSIPRTPQGETDTDAVPLVPPVPPLPEITAGPDRDVGTVRPLEAEGALRGTTAAVREPGDATESVTAPDPPVETESATGTERAAPVERVPESEPVPDPVPDPLPPVARRIVPSGTPPSGGADRAPGVAGASDPESSRRGGEDTEDAIDRGRQELTVPDRVARTVPMQAALETADSRSATAGEMIEVRLPGRSWLYLGSTGPVEFLSRETPAEEEVTLFAFQVRGPAVLEFESQDLATGQRQRHVEEIETTPTGPSGLAERRAAADRAASAAGQSGDPRTGNAGPAADSASVGVPADVTAPGPVGASTEAAVSDPGADDLPRDGGSTGNPPEDGRETAFDLLAFLETVDAASLDSESHRMVLAALFGENRDTEIPIPALIRYGDLLADQGRAEDAVQLFEQMWTTPALQGDTVLFRLAALYEGEPPVRDLRRSRELYSFLRDRYPFSRHYQDAGERIQFLDRHFFHIR